MANKRMFKKCDNCNGDGIINTIPNPSQITTAGNRSYAIQCPKCLGTGKFETDYFIEE